MPERDFIRWSLPFFACTLVYAQEPSKIVEPPITPKDRQHWAYQTPRVPTIPTLQKPGLLQSPVDFFIAAKLEARGLTLAEPADKRTLLRRVSFDLVGLPPSPEEMEAFLTDSSPRAYEKVVERLLNSPHYGERQAQHWLDVVRFAESNGYEMDGDRPHAWRYRDYVVRSFNADKPYNRFLIEQIAGDELAAQQDPRTAAELLVAAGLHRCGPVHLVSGNIDPEVARQEVLTEFVQGVGSAVLGSTFHCARCHDHKFDPVSQADYYRLEAFFAPTKFREITTSTPEEKNAHTKAVAELTLKISPLKAKVNALDEPYRKKVREQKIARLDTETRLAVQTEAKKRTPEQLQKAKDAEAILKVTWDEVVAALSPADRLQRERLRAEQHALEAQMPTAPGVVWTVENDRTIPATHVLKRGEVKRKIGTVEPAFPRVLLAESNTAAKQRLTRLDLAHWLTDPRHPLTGRVFVNRVWGQLFGRALVTTPNDFGLKGAKPTHPELLDYLATEFVRQGWSIKALHKMLVLSQTYQQSSVKFPPQARTADPDNQLLSRMNRRRRDGEALRDAILHTAGTLNPAVGGPSVRIPLEPEVYDLIFTEGEPDGLWPVTPDERQHTRRALYLFAKRNVRLPMLEAFDQPDRLSACAERSVSTFAPQALILMNGPFTHHQSRAFASAVVQKHATLDAQITYAYQRAYGRTPDVAELADAKTFIAEQQPLIAERLLARLPVGVPEGLPPTADPATCTALADFCLALFNSNEFIFVP